MVTWLGLSIEKGLREEKLTGQRGKEDLRLAGHRLVRRRHTHVGAPNNRIKVFLKKEHVLTPRGKDMNPVLGPVVAASPKRRLSYSQYLEQCIFELVRKGKVDTREQKSKVASRAWIFGHIRPVL